MAKRKKKAKTGRKKAVVRKTTRKKAKQEQKLEVGYEEVIVKCPSCGREFRLIKSSAFSTEGMLCQRCAAGGGVGLEEDDDF